MTTTVDATDRTACELIQATADTPPGDPQRAGLRARAIEAWLPMAYRLAGRYAGGRDDLEDLRQTATVGLIKAVDGFDPGRGGDFVAYAVPTIVGELKRYFRDRCWTIRPPRRLHNLYLRIRESQSLLAQRLGHRPTAAEVAADLDLSVEDVLEGLECGYVRRARSLSAPALPDAGIELGDLVPAGEDDFRTAESHLDLNDALAALDDREQRIIALYFYGNRSQAEIAGHLGLSQMHISRLIQKALATLRARMAPTIG